MVIMQYFLTIRKVAGIPPFLNLKAQIADKRVSTRKMNRASPKAAEAVYVHSVPAPDASIETDTTKT